MDLHVVHDETDGLVLTGVKAVDVVLDSVGLCILPLCRGLKSSGTRADIAVQTTEGVGVVAVPPLEAPTEIPLLLSSPVDEGGEGVAEYRGEGAVTVGEPVRGGRVERVVLDTSVALCEEVDARRNMRGRRVLLRDVNEKRVARCGADRREC